MSSDYAQLDEVLNIVSSMLRGREMQRVWKKFYPARAHNAPDRIAKILEIYPSLPVSASENTEILSFLRHFIETERRAIGKTPMLARTFARVNQSNHDMREKYDEIAGYLRTVLPDDQLIKPEKLRKDYKEILHAQSRQLVFRFRPFSTIKNGAKHFVHDVKDIFNEFPITSRTSSIIAAPLVLWLLAEGYAVKNADVQLGITATGVTNTAAQDVFGAGTEPALDTSGQLSFGGGQGYDPEIKEENFNKNFETCHDNLKDSFPLLVGALEANNVAVPDWPHCIEVDQTLENVQGGIMALDHGLRTIFNAVFGALVDDRLDNLNNESMLEGTHFMNGATKAANFLRDFLYFLNRIENAIHPVLGQIMLMYGFASVMKLSRKTPHEWEHLGSDTWSFLKRMPYRGGNYLGAGLAVGAYLKFHGYDATSFIDSNVLFATALGAFGGYLTHRFAASAIGARKHHAMNVAQSSEAFFEFTSDAPTLTDQKRIPLKDRFDAAKRRFTQVGSILVPYTAIVTADVMGFIDRLEPGPLKDVSIQLAEIAGIIPVGTVAVTGSLAFNFGIEDPAQHIGFMVPGYVVGAGTALVLLTMIMTAKGASSLAERLLKDAGQSIQDIVFDQRFPGTHDLRYQPITALERMLKVNSHIPQDGEVNLELVA